MKLTPRYYQEEAVEAIIEAWLQNTRALIGMATGTGKTFTLAYLMFQVMVKGKRAIFIVHEEGLMYQAHRTFSDIFVPLGFTVGMVRGTAHADYKHDIVIAMVQSLSAVARLKKMGYFDYIMIDEAHHYIDNVWAKAVMWFVDLSENARVVGCTATHYRKDGKSMGMMYPDVAEANELTYYYSTTQGIRDGYLSRFEAYMVETTFDISHMKNEGGFIGTEKQWNDLWEAGNWAELLYDEMVKKGFPNKLTIGFMPSVQISNKFAKWLSEEHDLNIGHVDGDVSYIFRNGVEEKVDRKFLYDSFRGGDVRAMFNYGVATEGFDAPEIEIVVMNRPSYSPGLVMQMLGRGLRVTEKIPDKVCTFMFAGFKDSQARMVDYSGIAGAIPSKEVDAVEEALTALEAGGIANENPICPHCQEGHLNRVKGTEMWMCDNCRALISIPVTGEDDQPLFDPSKMNGVGVKAKLIDLLHKQPVAWYKEDAVMSVGIGVGGIGDNLGERTVMIFPPGRIPSRPEGYSIVVLFRKAIGYTVKGYGFKKYKEYELDKEYTGKFVGQPFPTMGDAIEVATKYIEKYQDPTGLLSDKGKGWRKDPASAKQVAQCIGRFKMPAHRIVDDNGNPRITKGDASRIYAHHNALYFLRGNAKRAAIID